MIGDPEALAGMATYSVMGCTGAMPKRFTDPRKAIKFARQCARKGHVPVNVNVVHKRVFGPGESFETIFRCNARRMSKRGGKTTVKCGPTYSKHAHHAGYASWERQQRADGYLKGTRKRRGKSCPSNVGKTKAPKRLRRGR